MYEYVESLFAEISKLESLYDAAMSNNSFVAALGARKNIQALRQEIQELRLEGYDYGNKQSSASITQTEETTEELFFVQG